MFHKDGNRRRAWKERAFSLFLAAVLLLGSVPGFILPSSAHWADPYLDQLVDWGVMRADQTANPDTPLTRAEFMAIINRAYGYKEMGPIPFEDVVEGDWFYDDVAIAYNAGYMKGTSKTTASPNARLTREQAICILGRNMMLKETPGEDLTFSDSRSISGWARGMVKTAVNNYIVTGYPDDTFRPKDNITKGQMAVLVSQCVGNPVSQSGTYEMGDVSGNLTITAPNVTLRNTTVSGDLYVSGGVGLGGIKLENVNVLGRIVVSGTGESEAGAASVLMRNVTANEMLVDNMRNKTVTVRADGITEIPKTIVRTSAYLEDNNTDDKGLMSIELDGDSGSQLTLAGRIKEVVNKTPNSLVQAAKGTVAKLTVDEAAVNANVQLDRNTSVKEMNLDVASNVMGDGDIDQLNVNAPGSVVAMLPDKIYIRPGLTGNIAGVVMDHQAAEEGSLDPRLLSGYPAVKDITPTGLRADFSGNKKGTVYWAVSSITDGSIGEDDLISPPSYGSKAIRNGSVALPTGGSEVSAQVTGLTVGGSYYLSAILVDDLGNRSPVKAVSFSTPDNTVPAFGQGYPYMSFVGKANEYDNGVTAQVAVMATKTCRMYYAVLPAGAAAPTMDELRSASVSSNVGYGVVELEKNDVWDGDRAIIVSRRLEEQKDYVLYLWLTDGVNNSEVTNLAFTTPDVTPPEFVANPRVTGDAQATTVPMTAAINENGTIFWVAVKSGADYPLPNPNNDKENTDDGKTARLDSEYAKIQVANGMNAVSKGSVTATANTPVNLNITGLQAETSYDVYFLIRDTAGNNAKSVYKVPGGVRTLDTGAPTVKQSFTSVDAQDPTRPRRNTSIILEFSENVVLNGRDLLSLYEDTQTGTGSERETALQTFTDALRDNIRFFVMKNGRERLAVRGARDDNGNTVSESDWAIDFSKARVANVNGAVQITFPSGDDSLRLDSGATYFFRVGTNSQSPIADLSGHNMENTPVDLDKFTIVFAWVDMTSDNFSLDGTQWPDAIEKENDANEPLGIGRYQVDFKFRLMPQDTESSADSIAYDLLLWSDTNIEYDLYYRAVTESGRVLTVERDTENPGHWQYADMPNMSAVADDHGWVKLGESGVHNIGATSNGRASKRLHYVFNECDSQGDVLPSLNKLPGKLGNEEIYYDFAVSVHAINGRTDPNSWGETVKMYVDVAAGYSENLFNLGASPTVNDWRNFRNAGLNSGGGESIGSADRYEGTETRQLFMTKGFKDTVQPSFQPGYPTFTTTEDSVTMNLSLTRPGTVYYVVGYAHNDEDSEPADTTQWTPTITTRVGEPNTTGRPIRPEDVPRNGSDRDNGTPDLPTLSAPENTNIQNPNNWPDGYKVVPPGNVACQEVSVQPVTLNGLKPNRTYYIYYVITGTDVTPSAVEIYKFKTNPVTRPEITIVGGAATNTEPGRAELKTNMGAELTYKVYSESKIREMEYMGTNDYLRNNLYPGRTLPAAYQDYTIYDALKEVYTYRKASKEYTDTNGYFPSDGSGGPSQYNKKYSVFDIYASERVKDDILAWLERDEQTGPATQGGPKTVRAEAWEYSERVIQANQTYYVIAMARKEPEDVTTAQSDTGVRYSFMGNAINLSDENPPQLTGATGNFTVEENAANHRLEVISGTINLVFDKKLWINNGGTLEEVVKNSTKNNLKEIFLNPDNSGIDFDNSSISVSNSGITTISLALKGPSVSAMIANGRLQNGNVAGSEGLQIVHSPTKWPDRDTSTETQGFYYINVFWGANIDQGREDTARKIQGTGPGIPEPTDVPTTRGASTSFTVSNTDAVDGTSRISFSAPLYVGENTPVTSVKQLADVADEIKGIDLSQSQVINSEDGTTLVLKLKGKVEDVSLKINGGKLTNSAGEAAKEALTVQVEKRVETNQANMKLNNFYTDVSWGDQTWTDKGTNK